LPAGWLSAGEIAAKFNVVTKTDRLGLQWALRDFREAYPDKVQPSGIKGCRFMYFAEAVLPYLKQRQSTAILAPIGDRFTVPARNEYFRSLYQTEGTIFHEDYRAIQRHWDALAPPEQRVGSGRDGYDVVRKGVQQATRALRQRS
jgi:hypothetical protein